MSSVRDPRIIVRRFLCLAGLVAALIFIAPAPSHAQGAYTLSANPSTVSPGGSINVSWTAPAGRPATDWVGLYKSNDPDANFISWQYTNGAAAGTTAFVAPAAGGDYEFRYFLEDGFSRTARSNTVTVSGASTYMVTTPQSSVAPGGALSVSWTAPAGRPATDWVGLFRIGIPNTAFGWWQYTNGAPSGTFTLAAPGEAGEYEFRYLLEDGFTDAARSGAVTVATAPGGGQSHADTVRFLEQATWGPTSQLVSEVQAKGFENYLNEQFAAPMSSYPTLALQNTDNNIGCPADPANPAVRTNCIRDNYSMYPLQNRFFENALYSQDQLRQRVAFALHQIIVTSGVEITQPSWMAPYLQTLDRNAFGNYRQLLYEITLNPAMGNYLDMAGNTRTRPNENYAREILQLFSVGTVKLNQDGTAQRDAEGQTIPTYTQTTVNNFARVFTGWNRAAAPATGVPNYIDPMIANQGQHDIGTKTLLRDVTLPANQTAAKDLNDALDNIFTDPSAAPFISKQLIQHLVTSNPSPAYVARVANVFDDNGAGVRGDLKAVVKAILLDAEARGDAKADTSYGRLRHPAQLVANLCRAFNAKSADGATTSDGYLNPQSSSMGMDVFRSASVFSYFPPGYVVPTTGGKRGPEFGILSTSTALRRANFVNTMVFSRINVGTNAPRGTSLDFTAMQALAGDPAKLVDELNNLMMHGTMSAEMRQSIIDAVTAVAVTNPLKRARTAVYLVATSSQYQVER